MMRLYVIEVTAGSFNGGRKAAYSGGLVFKNRQLHDDVKNHRDGRYKRDRHADAREFSPARRCD